MGVQEVTDTPEAIAGLVNDLRVPFLFLRSETVAQAADTIERQSARLADVEAERDIFQKALERILAEADSDFGATAWDGGDVAREALAAALKGGTDEQG